MFLKEFSYIQVAFICYSNIVKLNYSLKELFIILRFFKLYFVFSLVMAKVGNVFN